MNARIHPICWLALALIAAAGPAVAQGYRDYPYSIMAPERGTRPHGRPSRGRHVEHFRERAAALPKKYGRRRLFVARGSSGSVLPTPLPRTPLIPPEGGGIPAVHALPQQQGPTIVPGLNPVPNLPHGAETFQDRASRCAHQGALYGVPNTALGQYMSACAM